MARIREAVTWWTGFAGLSVNAEFVSLTYSQQADDERARHPVRNSFAAWASGLYLELAG